MIRLWVLLFAVILLSLPEALAQSTASADWAIPQPIQQPPAPAPRESTAPIPSDQWVRMVSPHFHIVTDAGEMQGRALALYLEQMRSVFGLLLMQGQPPQGAAVQVLAFATHSKLNDFGLLMDRDKPTGALVLDAGDIFRLDSAADPDADQRPPKLKVGEVYLHDGDEDFALVNLASPKPWRTVLHSYAHQLQEANLPPTPRWFTEGVAEYFSVIRIEKEPPQKDRQGKLLPPTYHALLGLAPNPSSGQPFSILELFDADKVIAESEAKVNSKLYTAAWRVVEFLISAHKLQEAQNCFALVRQNVPPAEAIQRAFGVSSAELEKQMMTYFAARPRPTLAVMAETEISVFPSESLARQALYGEVHMHEPGYHRTGSKELDGVLKADPDNPVAHRSLALDDMRRHDVAAALQHLAIAQAKDPGDWMPHYYRALIIRQKNDASLAQQLEAEARAIVRLNPAFAEGYAMLGSALGMQARNAEGAAAYEQALRLHPASELYAVNLAMFYCATDRCAQAKPIFAGLQNSKDLRIATTAQGYLQGLGGK